MFCGVHNSEMTEVAKKTTAGIEVKVYRCNGGKHYIVEKQKQEVSLMAKLTPEQVARIHELAKAMDKSFVDVCQLIIVNGLMILEGESNAYKNAKNEQTSSHKPSLHSGYRISGF